MTPQSITPAHHCSVEPTEQCLLVTFTTRFGEWILQYLDGAGLEHLVGPVMVCDTHQEMHFLLAPDALHTPLTARWQLASTPQCQGSSACVQDWRALPVSSRAPVTDVAVLSDARARVWASGARAAA